MEGCARSTIEGNRTSSVLEVHPSSLLEKRKPRRLHREKGKGRFEKFVGERPRLNSSFRRGHEGPPQARQGRHDVPL